MAVEVLLEHFMVPKKTQFGTVQRSTCQDKVYIKNDAGVWKHCGYLGHASMHFAPLVGVPQELVEPIRAECERQKQKAVVGIDSIPLEDPVVESEDDEDEFEG